MKTRRNSGRSLDRIIADVNRTLRGWFASFDGVEAPAPQTQHSQVGVQRPRWLAEETVAKRASPPPRQARSWSHRTRLHHMAEPLLRDPRAVQSGHSPCRRQPILTEVNHQPESRMRETRPSGSEGGGTQTNEFSLPLLRSETVS